MRHSPAVSGSENKEYGAGGNGWASFTPSSYFESKTSVKQCEVNTSGQSHKSDLEAQQFRNKELSEGEK